jgi:hypothetical protein
MGLLPVESSLQVSPRPSHKFPEREPEPEPLKKIDQPATISANLTTFFPIGRFMIRDSVLLIIFSVGLHCDIKQYRYS